MQTQLDMVLKTIIGQLFLFGPLIIGLYLINLSSKRGYLLLRSISYSFVAILFSILFLLGILFQNYRELLIDYPALSKFVTNIHIFSPHTINNLHLIGPAIWLPALLGLFILIPDFRRQLSVVLPINNTRLLHALTLSLSMIIPILFLTNVLIDDSPLASMQTEWEIITSVWTQDIFLAIIGFIGVGWITRLDFKQSLVRLGLTKVSSTELLTGLLMGISLSLFVIVLGSLAAHYGFVDPKVTKSTNELLGPLFNSVFGILTLGLAAAIGEETIFRGALLPRFGLVFSSLLFALIHIHYGISFNLFVVFLLGLILGVIRNKYNTTISMVVHATYNIIIGLLAYLAIKLGT